MLEPLLKNIPLSDGVMNVAYDTEAAFSLMEKVHQYGRRWAAEGYFSAVKRRFGESVRATSI